MLPKKAGGREGEAEHFQTMSERLGKYIVKSVRAIKVHVTAEVKNEKLFSSKL